MKIIEYILYIVILYCAYLILSTESSIIEHIKKETILNPSSGRNALNVGDWKFITAKGEKCETNLYPSCDKLYIQDPDGSKILLREISSTILDKKYD
tara:strand:- start:358 stop:648 length:291 start_codon:yes stop_codon:yes gene_type:complete